MEKVCSWPPPLRQYSKAIRSPPCRVLGKMPRNCAIIGQWPLIVVGVSGLNLPHFLLSCARLLLGLLTVTRRCASWKPTNFNVLRREKPSWKHPSHVDDKGRAEPLRGRLQSTGASRCGFSSYLFLLSAAPHGNNAAVIERAGHPAQVCARCSSLARRPVCHL